MGKSGCVLVFMLICIYSFGVPPVMSIRCFRCDHNEVSSGNNFILSFVLKQMSKVDHPECKMKNRRDRHSIDIIECPPPSDWGSRYVCGTIRGTVAGTWKDLQVQFETLKRDCIQVPTGESNYADRCVESSMMDGPTQFLLEEAIEALGNFDIQGDVKFNGKTCYDTHGVPVQGHQVTCPTCSYNEMLSVNSLFGPLVEAFSKNNEEACRLHSTDDNFLVGYRVCKPSYQGQVNKCIMLEGEVTTKLLSGVGGGIDVRYFTVSRGCAKVDMAGRERDQFRDGCHTELPLSAPIRKLLVQGYKGASSDMGDMRFTGKVCYNNETFSAVKPTKNKTKHEEAEHQHRPPVTANTSNLHHIAATLPLTLAFIVTAAIQF